MEEEDRKALLKLARDAIDSRFAKIELDLTNVLHLNKKVGVFVTLNKRGKLRGCIGFIEYPFPLYKGVIEAAKAAAFNDPRFPVVTRDELRDIKIEISILTEPAHVEVKNAEEYLEKIEIGKDGLILQSSFGSGLLLPQVATENNFTAKQFLNCLAQKAGLSFNAWEDKNSKIFKFQAEVFDEKE